MSDKPRLEKTEIYQIKVEGVLDEKWADWFDGFTITNQDGHETILQGSIPDQEALHGLLARIRDLGLPIRSITRLTQETNPNNETSESPPRL